MVTELKLPAAQLAVPSHHDRFDGSLLQLVLPARQGLGHIFESVYAGAHCVQDQQQRFRIGVPALFGHIDVRRLDPV